MVYYIYFYSFKSCESSTDHHFKTQKEYVASFLSFLFDYEFVDCLFEYPHVDPSVSVEHGCFYTAKSLDNDVALFSKYVPLVGIQLMLMSLLLLHLYFPINHSLTSSFILKERTLLANHCFGSNLTKLRQFFCWTVGNTAIEVIWVFLTHVVEVCWSKWNSDVDCLFSQEIHVEKQFTPECSSKGVILRPHLDLFGPPYF
jgi:hypothetical protein